MENKKKALQFFFFAAVLHQLSFAAVRIANCVLKKKPEEESIVFCCCY